MPVVGLDGSADRLRARLGRGFLVVLVAPGTAVWSSEYWLGAGLMPQLTEATESLPLPAELLVTEAYPGAVPHTVLLIRPDGHLVAALRGCHPDDLWTLADRARGSHAELPTPRAATPTRASARASARTAGGGRSRGPADRGSAERVAADRVPSDRVAADRGRE